MAPHKPNDQLLLFQINRPGSVQDISRQRKEAAETELGRYIQSENIPK